MKILQEPDLKTNHWNSLVCSHSAKGVTEALKTTLALRILLC